MTRKFAFSCGSYPQPRTPCVAPIERFEDIDGWKKSRDLQQAFSDAAHSFSDFKLKDQMLRCTDSAMSNISEGFDAGSNPEFVRFLNMSYRSLTEFQSHLYTCKDRRHLTHAQCEKLFDQAEDAKSKVGGFIRYLKAHPKGPPKDPSTRIPSPPRKPRRKAKFDPKPTPSNENAREPAPTPNPELRTNPEPGTQN